MADLRDTFTDVGGMRTDGEATAPVVTPGDLRDALEEQRPRPPLMTTSWAKIGGDAWHDLGLGARDAVTGLTALPIAAHSGYAPPGPDP